MADTDEARIRQKAHELWEADGRRHGRDHDHWLQAKEIIAIQDSQSDTLLPRDTGAQEPVEDADEALRNLGDFPNLTDQGENLLTSTDREPTFGGPTDMPSVEVPTSDQPGIPAVRPRPSTKPDNDMKASPKNSMPEPGRTEAPKNTKAAVPSAAVPPPRASSGSKPAASPKKP